MLKIRNSFLTITLVVAIQSCTLGTSNSSNSTTQDIPDIKYIVAGKALYTVFTKITFVENLNISALK